MKWIDEYFNWLHAGYTEDEAAGGWTEIGTPFLDRHNDGIAIYVRREGDTVFFSDDGYFLNDLTCGTKNLPPKWIKNHLKPLLLPYGVDVDGMELVARSSVDEYPFQKHMFLHAILAVNDIPLPKGGKIDIFSNDVARFFVSSGIIGSPNVSLSGASGFTYRLDFVIPALAHRNKPERIVRAIKSPNQHIIQETLFAWDDIRAEREADNQLVIFLGDHDGKIMTALEKYHALPIPWAKRNEYIAELAMSA